MKPAKHGDGFKGGWGTGRTNGELYRGAIKIYSSGKHGELEENEGNAIFESSREWRHRYDPIYICTEETPLRNSCRGLPAEGS